MINKHCDLIYCNSLKQSKAKQSKANAKLYLLTNNYFKFLFQFQKYFLDLFKNCFAILSNNAKKIDNNVALAHCVHLEIGRKGLKPLVIGIFRIDCHASFHSARNDKFYFLNNNVAFPKNTKKYNNNVASAHCVQLQMGCKGFPERDAERKPHCYQLQLILITYQGAILVLL